MQDQLYFGFAKADITPAIADGVYLDGYGFRLSPAEGILSPIEAKVCVLQSGQNGTPFALFSLDVCGFSDQVHQRLRNWISLLSPILQNRIALCATHTHAGPASGVLWGLPVNMLYWDKVGKQLGTLANEALANLTAGELRLSAGTPFTASANRRGKEIIDRRVPVLAAYGMDGALRGVIASASCHAVASNDMRISADYPGVMAEIVGKKYNVPVLFLQGRGADINPTEEAMCAGETRPQVPGEMLADSVLAGLATAADSVVTNGDVRSVTRVVELPYAYPSMEAIEQKLVALKASFAQGFKPRSTEMDLLWHEMARNQVARGNQSVLVPVLLQLLSVGDITFAFLPFEILTSTGNAIESILPKNTLVIGYANGTHGYLAPADECGLGDYETCRSAHWYGMPECIPQTEQSLLRELRALSEEL